jgi:hypothetical protein
MTVLFALHFAAVVAYIAPWPDGMDGAYQVSKHYIHPLMLLQKWNIFLKPNKWDKLLVHEGQTTSGEWVELVPTNAAPEGWFVRWGYSRMTKVHNVVAFEGDDKHFTLDYADWLCRNAPDDVVALRLTKRAVKHRSRKQWAKADRPPQRIKDKVVWEQSCLD